MRAERTDGWAHDIVGADRDPQRIAAAAVAGSSIVLSGLLGSGKSHLLRAVASALTAQGLTPLLIRTGAPLSLRRFGALDACVDARVGLLRSSAETPTEPLLLIVDDVQELDVDSAEAIVSAVYGGRAVGVFGLTVGRDPMPSSPVVAMFVELWLHGAAGRQELGALTTREAETLLEGADAGTVLDSVSRTGVIAAADGSRTLLREFAAAAAAAARTGRDPLSAIRRPDPRSPLADALHVHLADRSAAELTGLAFLGRLPTMAHVDALRFVPAAVLDALTLAGTVHVAGPRRTLTAHPALAHAAERIVGPDAVSALVDTAVQRMLGDGEGWWSPPLAGVIAARWHAGGPAAPEIAEVAEPVRRRLLRDAVQLADDQGNPALALALSGLGGPDPVLAAELDFAHGALGVAPSPQGPLLSGEVDLSGGDGEDRLRRLLRMRAALAPTHPLPTVAAETPAPVRSLLEAVRAERDLLNLRVDEAARRAAAVFAHAAASPSTRLHAAWIGGLAAAFDARPDASARWFEQAARSGTSRTAAGDGSTGERLFSLCVEVLAAEVTGADTESLRTRLRGARREAVDACSPAGAGLAGIAMAMLCAQRGYAAHARSELAAALPRLAHTPLGAWLPVFLMPITRSLALLDQPSGAHELLQRADAEPVRGIPLVEHSRLRTLTALALVEATGASTPPAAQDSARTAAATGAAAAGLYTLDLFDLVALGVASDTERLRLISPDGDQRTPLAHRLAAVAARRPPTPASPPAALDTLRRGAPWAGSGRRRNGPAPARPTSGAVGPTETRALLTRRELEISLLASEGLSNRAMAERLFLSIRTVESHIYQARAKLGARSRSELGRLVSAQMQTRGDD